MSTNSPDDSSPNRDQRLTLRVTEAERAAIEDAAAAADRSISEHIRQTAADMDAAKPRVPPINREAWEELARLAANLNQLARRANELRGRLADRDLTKDWARRAAQHFADVEQMVDDCAARVADLRRSLYGAAPLELAADVLEGYRRAAKTGQIDADADRLGDVLSELRALADDIAEAS